MLQPEKTRLQLESYISTREIHINLSFDILEKTRLQLESYISTREIHINLNFDILGC